jgi:hypothetical protein
MTRIFRTETISQVSRSAKEVWRTVCFYEHVKTKPSWLLRTVLPVPQQTTGCAGKVGDESRCMYSDGGYLAKKITALADGERVDFDIIEQTIRYHTRIALCGGTIEVLPQGDGSCTMRMITRYEFRSRWLKVIQPTCCLA